MQRDVIVIGGGVIGCSIALRLAEAGLKVAVVERGRLGCEASRAAAGMLSPQAEAAGPGPFFDLCLASRLSYPAFAARVSEASGIDVEYKAEGTLVIAFEGEDEARLRSRTSWQAGAGLALERLSAAEARALEPALTEAARAAALIPNDHQVNNRRLMDGLGVATRRAGVEVLEGQQVDSILIERGRAAGVVCGAGRLGAGAVVVAAGCWSGHLLDPIGLNVEVVPAHGQMAALKGPRLPFNHVLHSAGCYLVPRRDGRVLIGATVEYTGYEKRVTAGGIGMLLARAVEMVPSLEGFEIAETWSGLRPDTADHLPVIGPAGVDGLYLATGHFRNGILLAPITAEAITEMIVGGRLPDEVKEFGVERLERSSEPAPFRLTASRD